MGDEAIDINGLLKELNYYKKRADEVAGENLKLDYSISGLRHELKQKRQGFALLSELQQTIGSRRQVSEILKMTITAINATLGMDKTVVLTPGAKENRFVVTQCLGFTSEAEKEILRLEFDFPPGFASGTDVFLVNKSTISVSPLVEAIQKSFDLPYFVCMGINVDETPIGLLLSGRVREAKPLYPPIDAGDVDTFKAIVGLISASVRNMRVVALEEMNKLKTDFFANISHEFRTPITLTIGPLEAMVSGRYGEIPEKVKNQISTVLRNQHRLLGLINQILDLAKLESGKMMLKAQRTPSINQFIEQRVSQFESMAEKRGLLLKFYPDPQLEGADIYLDHEKFDKVIFNLLSNAHKFTKTGGIEVMTALIEEQVHISIRDTGVGIRPDQILHIFDRFRQADGSTSREYAGTGIGLALVKELVELHLGQISVHSEYGKGTTFKIILPLGHSHLTSESIVESNEVVPESQSTTQEVFEIREGLSDKREIDEVDAINRKTRETLNKSKPTILYADDNSDLRQFVYDILSADYNVYLAVNGQEALKIARQEKLDLVLSDLMMPVMTGVEFLKTVRQEVALQGIPFVLLTAKSGSDSRVEGLETGADDYLSKPFSEVELLARLRNLIQLRQQHLRIKRDLQSARAIQQSLLPKVPRSLKQIRFEALYRPCEELSGDFFDIIESDKFVYFYLADVTSHGTASAQVTYLIKEMFQNLLRQFPEATLSELLVLAAAKYSEYDLDYSIGLQLMRFNNSTCVLDYSVSNAPMAVHSKNSVLNVLNAVPGPMMSTSMDRVDENSFPVRSVELDPGDSVYFFTDGCYEFRTAKTGKHLGYARFVKLLNSCNSEIWHESLLSKFVEIQGHTNFDDDITLLKLVVI